MEFILAGDYVVCDFSITHDCGSRLQQQFYVNGLINSRYRLLGENRPLGQEHRDGVVLIPKPEFKAFKQAAHQYILENPIYCYRHIAELKGLFLRIEGLCQLFEADFISQRPLKVNVISEMVQALTEAMSYNVLYEIYPEQAILDLLEVLFGSSEQAKKNYVDLHFSTSVPHYTRINLGLLYLALEWLKEKTIPGMDAFIRDMAFAFDFYIQENELENPATLEQKVVELAGSFKNKSGLLKKECKTILDGRERQKGKHLLAWKQVIATLRRSNKTPEQQFQCLAALGLRQALTTEEEERHFLQMRVQRNCRWAMQKFDLPLNTTSLESLLAACGN